MLLGLVVHSAITYGVYEDLGSWPIRDSVTHLSNDFIVVLIHSFRMHDMEIYKELIKRKKAWTRAKHNHWGREKT